jgi:hypothetical protein
MISPLNQTTYNTKEVPLIFAVNSTYVGNSLYCLDSSNVQNSSWQGLIGNGTLTNLSEGPHTLKLIITIETQTDIRYVEYRETVYFNVETTKNGEIGYLLSLSIICITSVIIASLAVIIYFKKLHRKSN